MNYNYSLFAIPIAVFFSLLLVFTTTVGVFAQSTTDNSNRSDSGNSVDIQPNISAENVFNTKTMTLGNNVQNLVILIPDEGHHAAGEDDEARFLDQHFVPENVVVNTGTTVQWFNGDAGHEHTIDVKGSNGDTVFNTGEFDNNQASNPFTFSTPGEYNYEAEGDPGVTMTGSIVVGNVEHSLTATSNSSINTTNSNSSNIDTVGVMMVPTQDIDDYIQQITSAGITVDNTYDFKDLRGGQKGTGDTQTLIVWTTAGKDLGETLSSLSELSADLPYS